MHVEKNRLKAVARAEPAWRISVREKKAALTMVERDYGDMIRIAEFCG
jgi:hypothetical protein